jgi:hypothetical protein
MDREREQAGSRTAVAERASTPLDELSAAVDRFWAVFPDPRSEQALLFVRACSAGLALARRGSRAQAIVAELDRLLCGPELSGVDARAAYQAARAGGLEVGEAVAAVRQAAAPRR